MTFAFPDDYWPANYWSEYWPDYGTSTPTGVAVLFMYYQQMRRRGR